MSKKRIVAMIGCGGATALFLWLAANREPEAATDPQSVASESVASQQDAAATEAPPLDKPPLFTSTDARQEHPVVQSQGPALAAPYSPPVDSNVWTADSRSNASDLSPLIRDITDPDNPRRKWLAVYKLPGKHSAADVAAMAAYLTDNPIGAAEYLGEEFAHRNYIMDVLRDQNEQWPLVADAFVRMYAAPQQGDVMRGYALQHLASLYIDNPLALPDGLKQRIIQTFQEALPERTEGTLAATALIGLHEISRVDPQAIPAREIDALALDLLRDPASGDLSRISSLHIAGERRLMDAVPVARRYAADSGADWVVRMAGIWLLGQLDGETGLLEQMARDDDENIRHAALAALAREK